MLLLQALGVQCGSIGWRCSASPSQLSCKATPSVLQQLIAVAAGQFCRNYMLRLVGSVSCTYCFSSASCGLQLHVCVVQAKRQQLGHAYGWQWEPWPTGQRPITHWSILLQEAKWLAVDVSQVSRSCLYRFIYCMRVTGASGCCMRGNIVCSCRVLATEPLRYSHRATPKQSVSSPGRHECSGHGSNAGTSLEANGR